MDTKSKKSSKIAKVFIALIVLIPAIIIGSLYPTIIKAMNAEFERQQAEIQETFPEYELDGNFIHYAVEASYYIYGLMLQEAGEDVDFGVLDWSGWSNDYVMVAENTAFHAVRYLENESQGLDANHVFPEEDIVCEMSLTFGASGNISSIIFEGDSVSNIDSIEAKNRGYESEQQYLGNVQEYRNLYNAEYDGSQLCPKNFSITFSLSKNNDAFFLNHYHDYYVTPDSLLYDLGMVWIIIVAAVFVAVMALILPLFKRLNTGWEKVFCIPFECVTLCALASIGGAVGLFFLLAEVGFMFDAAPLEIIGFLVGNDVKMWILIVASSIGWGICFFLEYIVVTSIRQFLYGPLYYCKNRLLIVMFLRWLKRKCVAFYKKATSIEVSKKLMNLSVLAVIINSMILMIICLIAREDVTMGVFLVLIYCVVLAVFALNYGDKIWKQYRSIVCAAKEMGEGNLKVELAEDLSVFQELGSELKKVQEGFEKAVVEEAKSQNMKTELITNVSHDLKTPLTAIITYVDLLKKEDITEEERKSYIQTLEQKSQRLKALIEDLFEVSKANSGNVVMNYMDVDVVNLMRQVKSEMEDQIIASGLDFRFSFPEEKIILSLDGQRTYRVFENLINNAIKYSLPFTRVYIDVKHSADDVKVMFRNVSARELDFDPERLTERFVRGDSSRNSEGSGLGLAIAKSFVELQKGQFEIAVDGDLFKVILTWKK